MSTQTQTSIDLAALIVSLGVLVVASLSDLKTREVSNKFWEIYAPVAAVLFLARIVSAPDTAAILLVSATATIVVAFLLFQFGAMGGADSKALMCIALALPVAPAFLSPLWQAPLIFYPFPIAILVNSFLLSISMMFILLGKNLLSRSSAGKSLFQGFEKESILRKALVLLTSYKTSFSVLQSSTHLYPAEQVAVVDSRPVRQLHLVSSVDEERDKLVAGLQGYKDQGLFADGVWVTPGLPHLVFITASLIVTVVIGDLLMWLFFRAVGVS
jgi:archaeal preflagellin peptidase FlaK